MKYPVNYLLSMSRIPEQFYALIHGLQGRDTLYANPGVSLRSFALAGINPLQELVEVEGQMLDILQECEAFSSDLRVYKEIQAALRSQPYDVVEKIIEIKGTSKHVNEVMKKLNAMNRDADEKFETLKRNTIQGRELDMESIPASEYKQSLIDLKFYASELVAYLESLPSGQSA